MTADDLETLIAETFQVELSAIKDGRAATTPDGKPASTMKERTELLKAAVEFWDKKRPTGVDSRWGTALTTKANGGAA
jgi:hypothetical protein